MELWDIYDENREFTGRTCRRGDLLGRGEFHLVAEIWIINHSGQLLLTQRDLTKPTWPGKWSPAGGAVIAGESSLQGAVRELGEETGISARENDLLLLHSFSGEHYFLDSYLACKDSPLEQLVLQPGETIDAKWVSLSELEAMMRGDLIADPMIDRFPAVRQKLEAALSRVQRPTVE